jgi:hypothetical protein
MTTPASPVEKKKPSVLKIVAVYCLVWLGLAAVFVAYVTFTPDHGGFVQSTANFVGLVGGLLFVPGLIYVLARQGAFRLFPKPHKEKSYYDEVPK